MRILLLLLAQSLLVPFLSAAILGYENFVIYQDYDATVGGLNGRIIPNGFDGNAVGGQVPPNTAVSGIHNWVPGPGGSNNMWANYIVRSGDLAYPGTTSSGGKRLSVEAGGLDIAALLNVTQGANPVFGPLNNGSGMIGPDGTTLYVSYLFQIGGTATANSQSYLVFRDSVAATNRLQIGQSWGENTIEATGSRTLGALDTNVHLVVVKIGYVAGDDNVSIWYDPNPLLDESQNTAAFSFTRAMAFDQFNLKGQTNTFALDELRLGTTWTDVVVPVPEPSSAALLLAALAAGTVLARRRR